MDQKGAQKQEQRKMMMLHEPISKVILKMSIPTIIAFLINSIYSLADTYFVSSLGTNATAAVSVNPTKPKADLHGYYNISGGSVQA